VLHGKQSSLSFDDHVRAVRFQDLVNQVGPVKALKVIAVIERKGLVLTVAEWIDHLTGVEPGTIRRYRSYLANDIAPALGATPLAALSRDDIALWNATVAGSHITANPCNGLRLPRWERREMVFLTESEFAILLNAITEYWRPLVTFLVASGARWSEATAL
jgi:hypothetical protein